MITSKKVRIGTSDVYATMPEIAEWIAGTAEPNPKVLRSLIHEWLRRITRVLGAEQNIS